MTHSDIRWQQRFNHYQKAFANLQDAVTLSKQRPLSTLEQQGLIQSFEFTHELAWNVIKDFFIYQGNTSIMGSRDATREAFHNQLITDGEGWMEMIKSRNQTSHTYNKATADDICHNILTRYYPLFAQFNDRMMQLNTLGNQT